MIKTVLFDMDGTLVPMDQEAFVKVYFKELCGAVCPLGITPDTLMTAVWSGIGAMAKNDGRRRNDEVFWDAFAGGCGMDGSELENLKKTTDRFYTHEFHRTRSCTRENPLAAQAVRLAHENGRKVVLATNPIFPMTGQEARLGWVGLKRKDFDLVTSYETDFFSKPNPQYFVSVCARIKTAPADCLMIGNDEGEDMYAASLAGLNCFLVTDCLIADPKHPWTGMRGSFAEMIQMLEGLR